MSTALAPTGGAQQILLRDAESTPIAIVEDARDDGPRDGGAAVVVGHLRPLRRRESGPLPDLRLDLADTGHAGRAVLLLLRPPVLDDGPRLASWASQAGDNPLVVVPEGGTGRHHVPAVTGVRLAQDLLGALGLVGDVRLAPFVLSGEDDDDRVAAALVDRLAPGPTLMLTATSSDPGARAWALAAGALLEGRTSGPLPGVDADVAARLSSWRPPRRERGLVVLMTGLSGSGKSTLARDLSTHLALRSDRAVTLLDGDLVRRMLSSGLGFDQASRELNVRRIGWVAARVAQHGGTAICSPIAPFARTRAEVRAMVEEVAHLVLVHVSTPLEECERRDLKGLYASARRGEIPDFTGISSPYEAPVDADVVVDTSVLSREAALARVVDHLVAGGWLERA